MQVIHIDNLHNQRFQIKLSVNGENVSLKFFVRWNEVAEYWIMDIINPTTSVNILSSIPLLPGINLLEPYDYLKIGSAYLVSNGGSSLDRPTIDDLGTNFRLQWGDNE